MKNVVIASIVDLSRKTIRVTAIGVALAATPALACEFTGQNKVLVGALLGDASATGAPVAVETLAKAFVSRPEIMAAFEKAGCDKSTVQSKVLALNGGKLAEPLSRSESFRYPTPKLAAMQSAQEKVAAQPTPVVTPTPTPAVTPTPTPTYPSTPVVAKSIVVPNYAPQIVAMEQQLQTLQARRNPTAAEQEQINKLPQTITALKAAQAAAELAAANAKTSADNATSQATSAAGSAGSAASSASAAAANKAASEKAAAAAEQSANKAEERDIWDYAFWGIIALIIGAVWWIYRGLKSNTSAVETLTTTVAEIKEVLPPNFDLGADWKDRLDRMSDGDEHEFQVFCESNGGWEAKYRLRVEKVSAQSIKVLSGIKGHVADNQIASENLRKTVRKAGFAGRLDVPVQVLRTVSAANA